MSTGSTAQTIADAGYAVTEVSQVTGFPESLDGRVKTLHPAVHAGILADLRLESHRAQLDELGIRPVPARRGQPLPVPRDGRLGRRELDAVIEQIDIGGPALVRASAKNHANVAIAVSPSSYAEIIASLRRGTTLAARRALAASAFAHTAAYDTAVAAWFAEHGGVTSPTPTDAWPPSTAGFGDALSIEGTPVGDPPLRRELAPARRALRARERPRHRPGDQLHGKEMSYNNYVDADAAVRAAYDFDEPAVAIIKHANPCGIAVAQPTDADADRGRARAGARLRPRLGLRRRDRRQPHRHPRDGRGASRTSSPRCSSPPASSPRRSRS